MVSWPVTRHFLANYDDMNLIAYIIICDYLWYFYGAFENNEVEIRHTTHVEL